MSKEDNLPVNSLDIIKDADIIYPGDKITREMKPGGDIVTKIKTKKHRATLREYMKKDGKPGKKTIVIMETEK